MLLLSLLACRDPEAAKPVASPGHSVLVLLIDGVRTDELCRDDTSDLTGLEGPEHAPHIWDTFAEAGLTARAAIVPGVTITAPAHAALVTGHPETYANFPVEAEGAGLYRPLVPTLFEEARAQLDLAEDDVALVANTALLEGVAASVAPSGGGGASYTDLMNADETAEATDAEVLDEVLRRIEEGPPRLMVVNLHQVDRAGHYGEDGQYEERITMVDSALGDFYERLREEQPTYLADLMIVLTADHGRHRFQDGSEAWRSHGDGCSGCREVPLFLVGGGATAGEELADSPLAFDVTAAMAAHLGVTMPWGEGLPLAGLDGTGADVRSGDLWASGDGEFAVLQRWLDDPATRSEVWMGDHVVSGDGVLAAEAPVVHTGDVATMACWRELRETAGDLPWVPTCMAELPDRGWSLLDFAVNEVNPFWRAALTEADGAIWAAWAENPAAVSNTGGVDPIGLGLARWTAEDGWGATVIVETPFPTDAALVPDGAGLLGAVATNAEEPDSRYTRHILVAPYTVAAGVATAGETASFSRDDARFELPALTVSGDDAWLATMVIEADGAHVEVARRSNGTWGALEVLPTQGETAPHVGPSWAGDEVVWVAEEDGAAIVCHAAPGDAAAACLDAGSTRVQSIAVVEGGLRYVRDAGVGQWETATLSW